MLISLASNENITQISELYHQVSLIHHKFRPDIFKKPIFENDLSYIKQALDNEKIKIFKAEESNILCGYLVLHIQEYPAEFFINPKYGFISSIGVDEKFQNKGYGKALISFAEQYLKSIDINAIEIDVYTFNTLAEKIYDNLGYKTIKHYKRKNL